MVTPEEVIGRIVAIEGQVGELRQHVQTLTGNQTQMTQHVHELSNRLNQQHQPRDGQYVSINHHRASIALKTFTRADYKDWRLTI